MGRIRYQLKSGVGEENIERLHREAVKLIEEVGIDVPHKKTLELLAEHEGVTIKGTRVHFAPPSLTGALSESLTSRRRTTNSP